MTVDAGKSGGTFTVTSKDAPVTLTSAVVHTMGDIHTTVEDVLASLKD